ITSMAANIGFSHRKNVPGWGYEDLSRRGWGFGVARPPFQLAESLVRAIGAVEARRPRLSLVRNAKRQPLSRDGIESQLHRRRQGLAARELLEINFFWRAQRRNEKSAASPNVKIRSWRFPLSFCTQDSVVA